MSDIITNVVVSMPSQLFTLARKFQAASNGKIYIGKIDTDPAIPENQIQVYLENEDGSTVPVAQPLIIGVGGYPVYNGQIAKYVTVEGHSMAVYNSYGEQQFYYPNVLKYDPDQLNKTFNDYLFKYFKRKSSLLGLNLVWDAFSKNLVTITKNDCAYDLKTKNIYARLDGKPYQIKQGDSPLDDGWIIATNKLNDFDIEGDGIGDIKIVQNLLDFAKRFGVTNLDFNIKNGKPLVLSKEIHVWTGLTINNFTAVRGVYRESISDVSGSTLVYTYGNVTINNINYDDKNYAANPPVAVWPDESTPNQTHYIAIRVSHRAGTHDVSPDGETPLSEPIEAPLYVNGGCVDNGCGTFFGGSKANSVITTDIAWGQFNDHCIYLSNDQDDDHMKMGSIKVKGGAIVSEVGERSNGAFKYRGSNFRDMVIESVSMNAPSARLVVVQSDSYNKGSVHVSIRNCTGLNGGIVSCPSAVSDFNIEIENCNFQMSVNSYSAVGGGFDIFYTSTVNTKFKNCKLSGENKDSYWNAMYNFPNGTLEYIDCDISEYNGVYVTLGLGDVYHSSGSIKNSKSLSRNSSRKGLPFRTNGIFSASGLSMASPEMYLISNNSDVNYPLIESHKIILHQNYGERRSDIYFLGSENKNYSGNNVISHDETLKDAVTGVMQRYDYRLFSPLSIGNGLAVSTGGVNSQGEAQLNRSIFNIKSIVVDKSTFTYNVTFHHEMMSNAYMVIFSVAPVSISKRTDGFSARYNSLTSFEFMAI
ncbi:phage head-binding domain-containing protein [Providencia sp.]|uniref:phage head-binding domain-containing protein n=1 Tax=Providencia sp. TaxID=589 RepID=UPI00334294F3